MNGEGSPVWQLNVGGLGYVPWGPREKNQIVMGVSIGQVCFSSNDQLIVSFTRHAVPEGFPRRGCAEASSNLRLDALFVDTERGVLRARREWPTFSDRSRIAPAPGNKFLVITPDKLTLFSPEIDRLKDLPLPMGQDGIQDDWNALASLSGAYLAIGYSPRDDRELPRTSLGKRLLVKAETLQVVWAGVDPGNGGIHIGAPLDDGEVLAQNGSGDGLLVGSPDGPWHPVALQPDGLGWATSKTGGAATGAEGPIVLPSGPRCGLHEGIPVNDHMLFDWAPHGVDRQCCGLAQMTGEIVFMQELNEKDVVRRLARSAGGLRFAVAVDKGKGGSRALDIAAHYSLDRIIVYDIPSRKWVFEITGKEQGIKAISGLALSPDGSQMALIDQDGILRLYRVPAN